MLVSPLTVSTPNKRGSVEDVGWCSLIRGRHSELSTEEVRMTLLESNHIDGWGTTKRSRNRLVLTNNFVYKGYRVQILTNTRRRLDFYTFM